MARTDRIAEPWGTRTSDGPGEDRPVRGDTFLAEGVRPGDVDVREPCSTVHSSRSAVPMRRAASRSRVG